MTSQITENTATISPDQRFNFTHDLSGHALAQPQAVALQISERVLTYQTLEDGVGRAATWLHLQGLKPKDIVALQMRDPMSLAFAMLGLMRLGATPMPLSPSATQHQVEDFVSDASAQCLLVDTATDSITTCTLLAFNESMLTQVRPLSNLACDMLDAACLLITGSGSTGKPRLIPVTHAQMRARAALLTEIYSLQAGDRLMVASPLHFATPIYRLLAALSAGVTGVAWNQRGTFGEAVEHLQPNVLHLSVLHAEQLLAHHDRQPSFNLASVRVVSIGASAVSESLRQRLRAKLGAALHINYGTNETLTVAFAYPPDIDKAPGVVGRPPPGVTVEVIDTNHQALGPGQIGQVRVRSPAQISAYLGGPDPERFREGWFYPGDLAEWTPDGQLVHCGRADQMMIMNGINIYPAEIERVIITHPAVREVLAFPYAHHIAQDLPICVVVLNDAITATSEEIQTYAKERLGLKSPRHVVILPSIPRNEQGKPARVQLNQQVRLSLQRSASKSTQVSTTTSQPRQRHQRSRRIRITLSPPSSPRADLVRPWRSLLTGSTTQTSAGKPAWKTAADEAFAAWLTELLLVAAELLRMVRVPVFDPLVPFQVQQLSASENAKQASWQAVLQVPVLDHLPTDALEPVMVAAIQSALRIATWAHQQAEGSSADADTRAVFFARTENEANTHLQKLAPTAGKSTLNVLAACHALGVPWAALGGDIYQLGWGARGRRIDRSTTEHDSAMGVRVTRDKAWTARLLRSAGLPAAEHEMVVAVAQALNAGNRIGWPVVIKPADAERGEGVSVDVLPADVEAAFAAAQKRSPTRKVLLERQVNGVCHRIFVAQNQLLYAVRRLPIGVYGNGADSIEKLVNTACALELTKAPWRRSPLKPIDELAHQELTRQGLQPDSVPPAGQFVGLRRIESTAWGGVDEDVTTVMHPENLRIALEAARLCGLDVAGVDVISPDISKPWHTNGAVINEINYAPLLGEGVISRTHIPQYLARLLGGNGRIAVDVFVGDEAATTAARKQASLLHQQGISVVVTSHDWTFWGHGQELVLSVHGLYARTRALILSPKIEALILVVQNDELSYSGLPLEGVDRVEIVNPNLACRAPQVSAVHITNLLQWLAEWPYSTPTPQQS